ncbi:secreted protein [Rhodopirellula maiorica SM1]|uniref:Secreted protein n=1 Tax=Rhodopirellula maiorica SM1 TaxID=1265738 RepID=M5RH96_9BACT|nr:secreted protein [Rhodopirellula maiorica SM1]
MKRMKPILLLAISCISMAIAGCDSGGPPKMIVPERSAEEIQAAVDQKEKAGQGQVD